jgi:hypothetical protein
VPQSIIQLHDLANIEPTDLKPYCIAVVAVGCVAWWDLEGEGGVQPILVWWL